MRRATWGEVGRSVFRRDTGHSLAVHYPGRGGTRVATATEVSTIGIVYAFIAGLLIYRQFNWRRVLPMLVETASLSGPSC